MQVLLKWRNVLIVKTTITQSNRLANHGIPSVSGLASFHSTNVFFEKWKNKFSSDGDQKPSKNYIRYEVRQKRADKKRALKDIIFSFNCSASRSKAFSQIEADYKDLSNKKDRINPARKAIRSHHKKLKRKQRKEDSFDDFDDNWESIFHAAFGKRGASRNYKPSEKGFNGRENFSWNNSKFDDEQFYNSRKQSDVESSLIRTHADRKILGLPITGPLKIEDVKAAFRISALKWHPDKHQGSLQADDVEEKFKQCVSAYKSLCDAFSST